MGQQNVATGEISRNVEDAAEQTKMASAIFDKVVGAIGKLCGEEDNRKLPVYTASDFDYVRVECCDTCKTYLKSVDLTKNGLAEPMVDEMAAAPLDLWAQQQGYSKLQFNVMGM